MILTNNIFDVSDWKQHINTAVHLYHFSHGGEVIYSPGSRDSGLWYFKTR
ncbi:Small ribosomal subunit biogenesis GTPase RsgA [Pantoea sp. Nvir]|nr:Small ribosomal subunit biogenesis GTPase RsgA [Pantoea sp. Nvir]